MLYAEAEYLQNTKSKPQIHSPSPYPVTSTKRNVLAFPAGIESSLNQNVITSNGLLTLLYPFEKDLHSLNHNTGSAV